jgi:hypothetical protein
MKKRAFIVGTSHSESSCKRDGKIEVMLENRWHDNLKTQHGYEVVNFSRAGCTVQQQFMSVVKYFQDNPDETFDLVIVEGRNIETAVSTPEQEWGEYVTPDYMYAKRPPKSEDIWRIWLDNPDMSIQKKYHWLPITPMDPDMRVRPQYMNWYLDYVHSYNHMTDTWSCNYALCNFLQQRSKKVFWYTHNVSQDLTDPDHEYNVFGKFIMKDFLMDPSSKLPAFVFDLHDGGPMTDEDYCECKHLNESGHKKLWNEIIYPLIKDFV